MKKILLFVVLIGLLFISFPKAKKANASYNLDKILNYDIIIEDNKDGTLDIEYHIVWKVLDGTTEGPLEWVYIGVANSHIKNLEILTDNENETTSSIDRMYKDIDGSNSCVKIYFKRNYYSNETVEFRFKLHQERIYTINKANKTIDYGFIPGWFDYIECEDITLKWKVPENTNDVFFEDSNYGIVNGYYTWNFKNVGCGRKVQINISFEETHFDKLSKRKAYISNEAEQALRIILIFVLLVVGFFGLIYLIRIIVNSSSDGYDCYCGFTGRRYWIHSYFRPRRIYHTAGYNKSGTRLASQNRSTPITTGTGSGGFSSGGHSCACACACACAGGGRAGCSRKDFYNTYPDLDKIIEALED